MQAMCIQLGFRKLKRFFAVSRAEMEKVSVKNQLLNEWETDEACVGKIPLQEFWSKIIWWCDPILFLTTARKKIKLVINWL